MTPSRRVFLLVCLAAQLACERGTHVVLVSIDTLRPDHLGCYGYARDTSPAIDAFCRDAVRFDQAIAPAPSTLPSHASLLTSLLPQHHGASFTRNTALDPDVTTLAEVLKAGGYATASWNGGAQLAPEWGLGRGFDVYESVRAKSARGEAFDAAADRLSHAVDAALAWLGARRSSDAFVFLHSYEVHSPYTPDDAYLRLFEDAYAGALPRHVSTELLARLNAHRFGPGGLPGAAAEARELRRQLQPADFEHVENLYDAEIRSADAAFGRLVEALKQRGAYDAALIVLTSDHGEEFGEHGAVGWHSHTLYDELLRVPLIVKLPDARHAGRELATPVRLIDVAPTLLAALGQGVPASFLGRNLLDLLDAPDPEPLPAVSWQDLPDREVTSMRSGRWKLYGERLYDLVNDPAERRDVSASQASVANELRLEREEHIRSRRRAEPVPASPEPETRERLRALGYLPE